MSTLQYKTKKINGVHLVGSQTFLAHGPTGVPRQ